MLDFSVGVQFSPQRLGMGVAVWLRRYASRIAAGNLQNHVKMLVQEKRMALTERP